VNPTVTTTYTVTYTVNGCSITQPAVVTVSPSPAVTATTATICAGGTATLTATGTPTGGTYNWSNGATGSSITVSPTATTNYTVTYTLQGCGSTTFTTSVSLNPIPTVQVDDTTICQGQTGSIMAVGSPQGGSYQWSNGLTTQTISGSPSSSLVLSVFYSLNGCSSLADSATIFVNPIPSINLGADTLVCESILPIVLSSPSSSTSAQFLWNTGNTVPLLTVTGEGTYSLVVTLNGCSNADTIQVLIDPCLSITENDNLNLVVFPNPTWDIIHVQSGHFSMERISIIDNLGKEVLLFSPKASEIPISTEPLSPGVYSLIVRMNGINIIRRIVKY
ncbi:MAG: hypothetical protein RL037_865, partial [Bacteroidota bacterium]